MRVSKLTPIPLNKNNHTTFTRLKNTILRWTYSFLHALLMLMLVYAWGFINGSFLCDNILLKWQSTIKNFTFSKSFSHSSKEDVLFIDVSKNKTIVFDSTLLENNTLTDRLLLDSCLNLIKKTGNYSFVLCDIDFTLPTAGDDKLINSIKGMQHLGFPHVDTGYERCRSFMHNFPGGYVSYSYLKNIYKFDNKLARFKLANSTSDLSLPLYMYLDRNHLAVKSIGNLIQLIGGKHTEYLFNNLTIDALLHNEDIIKTDSFSNIYTLDDFIALIIRHDAQAKKFLANKLIVIGDFENDHHQTVFGTMPGALILTNIYLSLLNHQNEITILWIVYLLGMFTSLSYTMFYKTFLYSEILERKINVISKIILGEIGVNFIFNIVLLFTGSLLSYFIFNKTINIFTLSIWMTIVEFITNRRNSKKEWFNKDDKRRHKILRWLLNIKD